MSAPYNVLHVMADQLTARALRLYGNAVCRTPHLDALAARGTVFSNHYCNFPLCAPSRASMLTGRLASRVGVYDNACDFPSHAPTIPYYMAALGYHTVLAGKMHFVGADQLHGYRERLTTDIYPSDFGWTPDWTQAIPVAGTGVSLRSVVEAGTCVRSLQLDYDDEVAARSVQWLYDHGRQRDAKPFYFTVSFTHPHNPYVITQEYWDRYAHDAIDMPRTGPIPYDRLDAHSRRLWKIYKFGQYDIAPEDVRRSRHAYYGMVSYVDDQLGRLLRVLREMELEERTIVVFTSDHGDMLGERGLWYKWMHFEDAVRVPLVVSVPGQKPSRIEAPVSLLDLMPTVVDAAGAPFDRVSEMEGISLLPAIRGEAALPAERPVFGEMTADGTTAPALMVRRGDWKYIACEGDPPQLYNLREDPAELRNLCGSAAARAVEADLRRLVASHWDAAALGREMQASARRRLFLQKARQESAAPAWDYEPRRDATRQYVRGGPGATAVKGLARFPQVAAKPPDHPVD
ncbi:MAG TPA: choline-sulfatase [Burkholderiales bacterium]|nr:choline-sulfatase [Burkholderiales bacterium]